MTLNQHCYAGHRDFDKPFRILVVGDGKGDSLIFLAVQIVSLPNAEIVAFNANRESVRIVRERIRNQAKRLSLPNLETMIDYRTGPSFDPDDESLGKFDYINYGGTSHHSDDPFFVLQKLAARLNDDGAIGITVCGQLGQTSVHGIREMMSIINRNVDDEKKKIDNTNLVLKNLPSSSLHRKNGRWLSCDSVKTSDLYLQAEARAFTFQEIVDRVAAAGLVLCRFASTMKSLLVPEYLPCKLPQRILTRLSTMNPTEAAICCEHLVGIINRYEFYVTKHVGTGVDQYDWDLIPSFSCYAHGNSLKNRLADSAKGLGESPSFRVGVYQGSIQLPIDVSPLASASYPLVDDCRTMREIVHKLASKFPLRTQESIRNELLKAWRHLIAFDMLQFRHVSSRIGNVNRFGF